MAAPIKNGKITTPFKKPGKMWSKGYHTGVDYAVPVGTEVIAVQSGTVTNANWGKSYGLQLVIDQAALNDGQPNRIAGNWAIYAHLSEVLVKPGDKITEGQVIAKTGNTGNSSGPHLHFEVRNNIRWSAGVEQDPMPFING